MSKIHFNDHLDDMMERLMNEDLSKEELDKEIARSRALCQVAHAKIEHNKTVIIAAKLVSAGDIKENKISDLLSGTVKQISQ